MKIVLLKIDRLRLKFLEIDRLNTRVHGGKKKKEEFEKLVRNWITLFIIIIIFLLY